MAAGIHRMLFALSVAAAAPSAQAVEALPILAGRWSIGDCARSATAQTRWFAPNVTASFNDRCRLTAERGADGLYRAHLACRYRAAHDDADDVVLEVISPTALRWVDQCSASLYRFCGRGEPPPLSGPTGR